MLMPTYDVPCHDHHSSQPSQPCPAAPIDGGFNCLCSSLTLIRPSKFQVSEVKYVVFAANAT